MSEKFRFFIVHINVIIVVQNLIHVQCLGQAPIVKTNLGSVRGVIADDGDYYMYLGIPFAKVDEDNPFGAPLSHPQYDGVFEANDDSAICPQVEEFNNTVVGTLDCLHLNVHVPSSASPTKPLPVFVWIYGGGYQLGFYGRFLYGPKFLVRNDIVFVTFNYRVGPYGFLCLDVPEVPGNQGLKDQLMALKWIRENIASFGGDPNKVTIAGNSAGSRSVDLHIMRKTNDPALFHQAILQSGTEMAPDIYGRPENPTLQLSQHLGLETNDIHESIEFLSKVDPLVIIKSTQELGLSFRTCIEKEFDGVEAFVTEDVAVASAVPNVKNMPVMIGFNNNEAYSLREILLGAGRNIVSIYLALIIDATNPDFDFIVKKLEHFYFGDEEVNADNLQESINFVSDVMFLVSTHRSMKRFLDNDVGDMYLYVFSYDGGRNFVKLKDNMMVGGGAVHADELGYLFDISYMDKPTSEDQLIVDRMTKMWANFVKYANPTPEPTDLVPEKWQVITKDSPYYNIEIDSKLSVGNRPFRDRMAFWDLVYEGYGHVIGGTPNTESEVYRMMKKVMLHG